MKSGICRSSFTLVSALFGVLLFSSAPKLMAAPAPDPGMAERLQRDIAQLCSYPSRVPGTPGNKAAAAYIESRFKSIGLKPWQGRMVEQYTVTVPVTVPGHTPVLAIGGSTLSLLPIYPNHVAPSSTPAKGATGRLIYAGLGRPVDYNGQQVEGAIVALDFNSGMNWVTAADLGARAVIFLEPTETSRGEAERKFAALPVEIPRYYAPRDAAARIIALAKGSPEATVRSQVRWDRVPVSNILGFIPGTDTKITGKPGHTLIVDGYYDSMAITPDLAPGGEAAASCAALLEIARYFKAHPAPYNLLFVANGAHHMALAGARNFAAAHFLDADGKGGKAKTEEIAGYRAYIGIDLTSSTGTVGLFGKSAFYNQMTPSSENILLNQFAGFAKTVDGYAQREAERRQVPDEEFYVDGITGREGRTWRSYLPSLVALDSEVATMAAVPAISFATANDARAIQDTPFDTPQRVNVANVAAQVNTITGLMATSMGDIDSLPESGTLSKIFGFAVGRAIYRNIAAGTSLLPDTPLPDSSAPDTVKSLPEGERQDVTAVGYVLDNANAYKTYSGVRGAFIERAIYGQATADSPAVAQFVFTGPRVADPKGGGGAAQEIQAYSINGAGRIIFAPDMGSERVRFSPNFSKTTATLNYKNEKAGQYTVDASVICFECRGTALYDTVDQRYFSVLQEMNVLDARTDANPVEFGFLKPGAPQGTAELEPVAIVYGRVGSRYKLLMSAGLLGNRLLVLQTNPAQTNYEGEGVLVLGGDDPQPVLRVSYQTANDLWVLDQQRIRLLKGFGISNERVDKLHGDAGGTSTTMVTAPVGGALARAAEALKNLRYDEFYAEGRRAFGLESRAYPDVEGTAQDVLKGIIFYLALLLPFSYFLERLLFGFPDVRKQITGTAGAFLLIFFCIRWVHPAFELALTPFIILLAFIILALTVVVTLFLSSKFEAEIKRLKQGVHFADVGRLSTVGAALGLGIANMRRRPIRTALTCVTLILLTFTVLSFTSVTASISNYARPYGAPTYQGLMVRQPDWGAMHEAAVLSMRNEFTARFGPVALRAWYLSRNQGEPLALRVNNFADPSKFRYAPALMGVTPEEKSINSPIATEDGKNPTIIRGHWFSGPRRDVCILPRWMLIPPRQAASESAATVGNEAAASSSTETKGGDEPPLGLTVDTAVGSKIQVAGQIFEVIGVFDDRVWSGKDGFRDLDGELFTPVDYQNEQNKTSADASSAANQKGQAPQVQHYEHMDANAIVLIPYDTALNLGGTTRSIAAGIHETTAGKAELQRLMDRAALGIFGSTMETVNGQSQLVTRLYSSVESTSYEGFASLVIPILIAAMIIANTMLGSVFERTREIGIYSSVGLAPVHVAALFIAESGVYAVLGSISGYLIAQAVAKIITAYGLLPGITLNYSSSSAVLSTLIVMATVLLSTLYPAAQASRMSQPDIDRRWRVSEPLGDLWRFQFPFTVSGLQPLGVAQFLADFFETHTDTSVGRFYTDRVVFSALTLEQAVNLLNSMPDGRSLVDVVPANGGSPIPEPGDTSKITIDNSAAAGAGKPQSGPPVLNLAKIAADPDTQVYRLAMRVWLAPFDMGVSQDTDIVLLPSDEPGLYELQLRLVRQSGEIAAWKRVNRQFISDLRKQLLLWRTIKPSGQREYILRGRAHVAGEPIPAEEPGAVVSSAL